MSNIKLQEMRFHTQGYGYIFDRRSRKYKTQLLFLNFFIYAGPILFASCAMLFDKNWDYYEFLKKLVGIIAILQIIISLWAEISGWSEEFFASKELKKLNNNFAKEIQSLDLNFEIDPNEFKSFALRYHYISEKNDERDVSEKEKRIGYRYSCYIIKTKCTVCNEIPKEMNGNLNCNTCSNY